MNPFKFTECAADHYFPSSDLHEMLKQLIETEERTFAGMAFRLILDFGNTSLKAALFSGTTLQRQAVLEDLSMSSILKFAGEEKITAAVLASVIHLPAELTDALKNAFPFLWLDKNTRLPFGNRYETPQTLGYDRIAAVAGARQLFPRVPVLAIMAGTCITYNLLDGENNFRGGAIAPGLHMRLQAMHAFTDQLPLVPLEGEHPLIGTTTETSLRAGVYHAVLAETEGMISRYENEFPGLKTVIGGGDGRFLADGLKNGIFARPNLVLEGLNSILEYHVATQSL
jgi:type III pantothenate kinase